jgi:hypothetical protein
MIPILPVTSINQQHSLTEPLESSLSASYFLLAITGGVNKNGCQSKPLLRYRYHAFIQNVLHCSEATDQMPDQ